MGQLSAVDVLGSVERGIAQTQVIGWDADVWRRDLADVDATFEVPAVLDRLIASATAHGGLTRSDVVDIGGDDEVHLLVASMAWGFAPPGMARSVRLRCSTAPPRSSEGAWPT